MGVLAVFPWLTVDEDFSVGDFVVRRYSRGTAPFGTGQDEQRAADALLCMHVRRPGEPVESATLAGLAERPLLDDLSDEEIGDLFEFAELLAFSGLAARTFFGLGVTGYSNRDTFEFFVRRFQDPDGGLGIQRRRRDGSSSGLWSPGTVEFQRPLHVPAGIGSPPLDRALLDALLQLRTSGSDQWADLSEAITLFSQANTDSDSVPMRTEGVLTISAFERLYDCERGRETQLVTPFADAVRPSEELTWESAPRIPEERRGNANSVREFWLRDFFRLRNSLAHGRMDYPSIWTLQEHLLLSAYIFPRAVKLTLAESELYELSEEDSTDIDVFEQLVAARLLEEDEEGRWPWDRIRGQFFLRARIDAAWNRMNSDPEQEEE